MHVAKFSAVAAVVALAAIDSTALAGEPPEPGDPPSPVVVIAKGLEFFAPKEIPSGWTTFRFLNKSGMTHFALIERMPEGIGIVEQQKQVASVFQQGMDLLSAGDVDAALEMFGGLPEWFGQVVYKGGPGIVGPEGTAETTVHLEPGTYLMECYVKTGGIFHSYSPWPTRYGMVREFTVTDQTSDGREPVATLQINISAEHGIEAEGDPVPGEHIVAVHFVDQLAHENFVGHDVHLARLAHDTDLEQLAIWMDWSEPGGLETPAPVEFLGGVNEMPAGETGYLHVRLEPGHYAWVAEVPHSMQKGMLRSFVVPPAAAGSEN